MNSPQQDRWEDKATGRKVSKLRVVAENVKFLGERPAGALKSKGNGNARPVVAAGAPVGDLLPELLG